MTVKSLGVHVGPRTIAERISEVRVDEALFQLADQLRSQMEASDILEAFTHHLRMGAYPEQLRARFKSTHSWSANEQSGMREASDDVIERLAQGNRDYLSKVQYIFIVCAVEKRCRDARTLGGEAA